MTDFVLEQKTFLQNDSDYKNAEARCWEFNSTNLQFYTND